MRKLRQKNGEVWKPAERAHLSLWDEFLLSSSGCPWTCSNSPTLASQILSFPLDFAPLKEKKVGITCREWFIQSPSFSVNNPGCNDFCERGTVAVVQTTVGESPRGFCSQETLPGESQRPHGGRETNTPCSERLSEVFYWDKGKQREERKRETDRDLLAFPEKQQEESRNGQSFSLKRTFCTCVQYKLSNDVAAIGAWAGQGPAWMCPSRWQGPA